MKKRKVIYSTINKNYRKIILLVFLFINVVNVSAQQYNVSGNAVVMANPNCYRLTNALSQAGAVWNIYMINLTQPFDITLTLNFGINPGTSAVGTNCGADGMSFILQPLNTGVVGVGGLVGFGGITPSLGVIMDDFWGNASDPTYHHISINKNGDPSHNVYTPAGICPPTGTLTTANANELATYCSASGFPANITDGLDHLFRFKWTPTITGVGTIQVWFGNATTLPGTPTISYSGNIVANIFGGNPNVFWGIGGSTGGCWNVQTVCMTTASNFSSPSSACVGDTVHFTNNSISGLPIQVWSWDFNDGTYSSDTNAKHVFSVPGTYNVNLAIFNSGGFFSTMTHTVTINPKPTVVVNDAAICKGDSATLTATGATSYTWNNGLTAGAIKKVAPVITTSYIVTGTNSFGCKNKDTALITINPNPVITATSDTICIGDTAVLTASGGNNYTWTPTGSNANPLKLSPSVTTIIKVFGTNTFGCKDSTYTTVVVNPNPIIHVANDTICLNSMGTLTATGAQTYVWGNNISTTNPFHVSPAITTVYTVVGTDINNCIGKDSAKVVINNPPVISVDSADICAGLTATLTVSGGNNLTYHWLNDNSTFNPLHASPAITTIYTVIATDSHGCKDTASGVIKIHPKPVPNFSPNSTLISTDAPDVVFTDQSASAILWQWNFGDPTSTTNTSNIQFPTHSFKTAGEYYIWLVVTSDFGCMDSTYRRIMVQTPNSFYIPNALISSSSDNGVSIFRPRGTGIDLTKYQMIIFDRWGKELFSTTNFEEGWNGKLNNVGDYLPNGIYVYYIKYKELYGIFREKTGSVTLIR